MGAWAQVELLLTLWEAKMLSGCCYYFVACLGLVWIPQSDSFWSTRNRVLQLLWMLTFFFGLSLGLF